MLHTYNVKIRRVEKKLFIANEVLYQFVYCYSYITHVFVLLLLFLTNPSELTGSINFIPVFENLANRFVPSADITGNYLIEKRQQIL